MLTTFQLETWKVEIYTNAEKPKCFYFATEALAKTAVEWAYLNFVEDLYKNTSEITSILEEPDPSSGKWKMCELYGKKVTYWKRWGNKGNIIVKNYFTAEKDSFRRDVVL